MPTENRSSNTEMVSVPRELLAHIEAALDRHMAGHAPMRIPVDPTDSDLAREEVRALLAQPAQHQGGPVALPARKPWNGLLATADNLKGSGWNACLDEIAKLGPLYTHPAPAEQQEPAVWGDPVLLSPVSQSYDSGFADAASDHGR